MSTQDVPNIGTILGDLSNFASLPDRAQQGFVNFMYLGRLMIHPAGFNTNTAFQFIKGGLPQAVIDPARLFYDGNSQGGIMGGSLTALAPDFNRAVLGVPGMNYSTLLRRSVDFDQYAVVLYQNYPNELERPLILSLIQTLWDRGEANGYAHHMTGDPLPNTPAARGAAARGVRRPPGRQRRDRGGGPHDRRGAPHARARPRPPLRREPVLRDPADRVVPV